MRNCLNVMLNYG